MTSAGRVDVGAGAGAGATTTAPSAPAVVGSLAGLLLLVQAQAAARGALTATLTKQVTMLVQNFTGWYSDVAVQKLAGDIARLVAPTQRLAAASTNSYLTRSISVMLNKSVRPGKLVDTSRLRMGVDPKDVYVRLADEFKFLTAEARGFTPSTDLLVAPTKTPEQVLKQVVHRATVMLDADVSLAVQHQSRQVMRSQHITGYRRVIHPELSKTGTCGLCIAASDRVYKSDHLMPLHALCKCEPLPIIGGQDPAGVLNELDLNALYLDAGNSTAMKALKLTRYKVNEHGELGPVLTRKSDYFRGPDAVKKATNAPVDPKVRARAEIAALEKSLAGLKLRAEHGADVGSAIEYHTSRIAKLRGVL